MQRTRWVPGWLALALLVPTAAHADPKDDARRHFAAGLEAAREGDFEIALQRFLAAQEAYPHPATLYNIAQAYMDLGDLANARTYYLLYRDAAPDKAEQIDPILAAIEARQGAPQETPTGPAETPVAAGGGATVVVAGPSEEELARLKELTAEMAELLTALEDSDADKLAVARLEGDRAELEALIAAVEERTAAQVAEAEATGGAVATGPEEVPETPEAEVPAIPEGGGFLEGAYDKIVVTASRVGQDPLDSPSTLTVLTDEDVRMMGAQNITDVLRRVAGVNIMENSAGHADVAIRGFQRKMNNKVLILVDGRSTYTDFVGATFIHGLPLSLEEIERIEVIRGPGSAVYGANAVTGVVNIITKTPGEREERIVKVDAGQPGLGRGTVYINGKEGDTAYRMAVGYQQHGRWEKKLDLFDEQGNPIPDRAAEPFFADEPAMEDLGQRVNRADGRIDQKFGAQGFASLSGGVARTQSELYNIGALPPFGLDLTKTYLRGDLAWGAAHLRAFWNADTGRTGPWIEQNGQNRTLDGAVDSDVVDVELEGPTEFSTGAIDHTLNLGVGYRFKRSDFDYFAKPPVEHHLKAFLNEQLSVGKLGAVASLRVDRHPLLDLSETISPRTALLYRIFDKTSLRATFGTAFRAPNHIESYMDFNLNNPAADGVYIRDLGDSTTLSPERIMTAELGVHDESTYFHTADAVIYMNRVTQLIDLSPIDREINAFNPDANGVEFGQTGWVNLDDVYTGLGFEGELELYPTDGLDVYGNLALQRVTRSDGADTEPDLSVAPLQVNAGTMYRAPFRMDFTYDLQYVGPQTWRLRTFDAVGAITFLDADLPSRVLMSTRVAGRPFADNRLELAATAWNFLALLNPDLRFREFPEGQLLGGRLFGTVSYTF